MTPYQFQSEDFALSDAGIHLLRNKFNFKTIGYDQVTNATIQKDVEIKRPIIVLSLGIVLIFFAVKQVLWVFGLFGDSQTYHIYIESIILPIIPGALGIYCVYSALRRGPVFKFEDDKEIYKLRLRSVIKKNQFLDLKSYLDTKLKSKLNNQFE